MCTYQKYDTTNGCAKKTETFPEKSKNGFPKVCKEDKDCIGNAGSSQSCSCNIPNTEGFGYCVGFPGEKDDYFENLKTSYARTFDTCDNYAI
jgi:hypothetical protein